MATPTNLPSTFVTGNILTAANMNNIRGAFRILQVVQGSTTTLATSTTSTYADTTLTATITPQSSSSLVLVMAAQNIYTGGASTGLGLRVVRGSTTIDQSLDLGFSTGGTSLLHATLLVLDNPATTSPVVYKTTFNRNNGASTVFCQPNGNRSSIILMEVSA